MEKAYRGQGVLVVPMDGNKNISMERHIVAVTITQSSERLPVPFLLLKREGKASSLSSQPTEATKGCHVDGSEALE